MFIDWTKDGPDGEYVRAAKVFDANGKQYHRVLWCNTNTGEMEYYETDNKGVRYEDAIRNPIKICEVVPAPIRIEWAEETPVRES